MLLAQFEIHVLINYGANIHKKYIPVSMEKNEKKINFISI